MKPTKFTTRQYALPSNIRTNRPRRSPVAVLTATVIALTVACGVIAATYIVASESSKPSVSAGNEWSRSVELLENLELAQSFTVTADDLKG
jgi:hypothetical protein